MTMMTVLLCAVAYLVIGTSTCIIAKHFTRLDEEDCFHIILLWPFALIFLTVAAPVWICLKVINKVCGD